MPLAPRRSALAPPPPKLVTLGVPAASVVLASLVTAALPVVATAPLVPPGGFLMLLAWRLLRGDVLPAWAGLPLGLVDDLLSGQPIGSAAALWTGTLLALDAVEGRFLGRGLRSEFTLAAAFVAAYLLLATLLARLLGALPSLLTLLPQLAISILAVPLALRLAGWLDRRRFGRR